LKGLRTPNHRPPGPFSIHLKELPSSALLMGSFQGLKDVCDSLGARGENPPPTQGLDTVLPGDG